MLIVVLNTTIMKTFTLDIHTARVIGIYLIKTQTVTGHNFFHWLLQNHYSLRHSKTHLW